MASVASSSQALAADPEVRPLRRLEYELLVEQGMLDEERIELLNGRLVRMSPQKDPHASAVEELTMQLVPALKGRARVRVQAPIALDDVSEPEPDIAIVALGRPKGGHPTTAIALIEVAETSVRKDLGEKAEAYAKAAIPEYWVVNIPARCIVVHLEPAGGRYRRITTYGPGEAARLQAFPDVEIRVDSLV